MSGGVDTVEALAAANAAKAELKAEIDEARSRIADLGAQLAASAGALKETQAELEVLKGQQADATARALRIAAWSPPRG